MRRYHVTTFGCQMNAHDSERIKGMLEELGLGEASELEQADVIVFNTCTIREKAESRLAAHLALAKTLRGRPGASARGRGLLRRGSARAAVRAFPQVDFAFGPGSIAELGEWLTAERNAARAGASAPARSADSPRSYRPGASEPSRPGCRSRWAATRSAPTASCRPCAAGR